MSRAFLRESDLEEFDLPATPIAAVPAGSRHYLTSRGAARLRRELQDLRAVVRPAGKAVSPEERRERQRADQRLRHLEGVLQSAEVIVVLDPKPDRVRFGTTVTVRDGDGSLSRYALVGAEETDVEHGAISYLSPLGQALLQHRAGDTVRLMRPQGATELTLVAVEASDAAA